MIALIQRVRRARVLVDNQCVGEIAAGLLAFVAIERGDSAALVPKLLHKLLNYRVFSDDAGKMNWSLKDVSGGLLLVSQFTLAADTNSGLRPSFTPAAQPLAGERLYSALVLAARAEHPNVATGQFGADMQVELVNDGPVTFNLRVCEKASAVPIILG
jgi:D-aminoacyl-tRNA deacylase